MNEASRKKSEHSSYRKKTAPATQAPVLGLHLRDVPKHAITLGDFRCALHIGIKLASVPLCCVVCGPGLAQGREEAAASLLLAASPLQRSGVLLADMGRRRWPMPPGLEFDDVPVGVGDFLAEWAAYIFEKRFDTLLTGGILMVIYDAVLTPCFWLLPMDVWPGALLLGIVIDLILLSACLIGSFVYGVRGQVRRVLFDILTCMPWELIGYASDAARPNFMYRTLAKVCRPVARCARVRCCCGPSPLPACGMRMLSASRARACYAPTPSRPHALTPSRPRPRVTHRRRRCRCHSCIASTGYAASSLAGTGRTCGPTGTSSRSSCG